MTLQTIPTTAVFYASINFGNDVNGNPRRFFRLYDKDMEYLGDCEDNYAGTNFLSGRNIKAINIYSGIQKGIREYKATKRTYFFNESLKA